MGRTGKRHTRRHVLNNNETDMGNWYCVVDDELNVAQGGDNLLAERVAFDGSWEEWGNDLNWVHKLPYAFLE